MRLPAPVLMSMEMGFNRALRLDPETQESFDELLGKVIAIEFVGMDLRLYLMPTLDGVTFADQYDGRADATIRGGVFSLMHTAMTHDRSRVISGDIKISGDVQLGQKVQRMLQNLELDWEEPLSQLVGDVAAHQLGRLAQGAFAFFSQAADSLLRDSAEYVTEESRDVVTRYELEKFCAQVDETRAQVERAAARVARLKAKLESGS